MVTDPKNLCETHELGQKTREWMVTSRRVPALGGNHTRYTGFTEAGTGYAFVRHAPTFSMVLATESGEGVAWVDGTWQRCPVGYAYVTAPHAFSAYHLPAGKTWRLHWVIYEESAALPGVKRGDAPRLVPVEATGLRHAIEGLCHENAGRADPSVLEFWAALVDRLTLRMLASEASDTRLDRLWQTVHANFGSAWTLARMARVAGMSVESLRRNCQRQLHCPPMVHLTRLRMLAAADLLCHTRETIAMVAERVGYADAFAFSTAFRRVTGRSPRESRRNN